MYIFVCIYIILYFFNEQYVAKRQLLKMLFLSCSIFILKVIINQNLILLKNRTNVKRIMFY